MKDIVISSRHVKKELWIFLVCLIAMELVNVYAIAEYDGKWNELLMSLGFVTVAAVVSYLLLAVIRLMIYGIRRILISSAK